MLGNPFDSTCEPHQEAYDASQRIVQWATVICREEDVTAGCSVARTG